MRQTINHLLKQFPRNWFLEETKNVCGKKSGVDLNKRKNVNITTKITIKF